MPQYTPPDCCHIPLSPRPGIVPPSISMNCRKSSKNALSLLNYFDIYIYILGGGGEGGRMYVPTC